VTTKTHICTLQFIDHFPGKPGLTDCPFLFFL